MHKTESILRTDTPEVRVTEWRLMPGDGTGVHRHNYDCVVVPITRGTLRLVAASGESTVELSPGASYFRKAGVEHNAINAGPEPLALRRCRAEGPAGVTDRALALEGVED